MELTIKSRKEELEYRFTRLCKEYICLNVGSFKMGQICEGGNFSGSTIYYLGNDINEFKKICRKWYRQHRKQY